MKIEVNKLKPNPFRHLERYPIDRAKIEALKRSIRDTGFWDNILVRKVKDGYEIAYGHHRLIALKQDKESQIKEIDVPVRDLDDTHMAKIMAHENMEEWGHSAIIEQETVRAIVEGYAEGKIQLPMTKHKDGRGSITLRYAPFFAPPRGEAKTDKPYTAATLAEFLGWNHTKIVHILDALSVVEDQLVDEKEFKDLTTRQAESVAAETRRVAKETGNRALAQKVGKQLAEGMKQSVKGHDRAGRKRMVQDVTIHNARRHADAIVFEDKSPHHPEPAVLPEINKAAQDLAHEISAFLDVLGSNARSKKLEEIISEQRHVDDFSLENLKGSLQGLAQRATKFANRLHLQQTAAKNVTPNRKLLK